MLFGWLPTQTSKDGIKPLEQVMKLFKWLNHWNLNLPYLLLHKAEGEKNPQKVQAKRKCCSLKIFLSHKLLGLVHKKTFNRYGIKLFISGYALAYIVLLQLKPVAKF